jgi:uncharacterized protein (TIGR03118 family)
MTKRTRCVFVLFSAALIGTPLFAATAYFETNLASDIPGLAANLDANLKNPWGMSFGPSTPFWVSNQGSNDSTLFNGAGAPQSLVVSTPPSPTGQVFNFTPSFLLPTGGKALFLFASLSGTISGWNAAQGTTAIAPITTPGAVFTGLAIGNNGTGDELWAADFANSRIDTFDAAFGSTTSTGGFVDLTLPAGYSPYNIQMIGGKLYVEYANVNPITHRATTTPNTGVVDVFDLNGNLLQRLATNTNLNSPWGITMAPAGFGSFGGDLLVGNFGDGTISVFDAGGTFQGKISGQNGAPLVNSGLWALNFRATGSGFDPNTLFLNAGINNEADGLFAEIQIVPEPGTWVLVGLALAGALALRRARSVRQS